MPNMPNSQVGQLAPQALDNTPEVPSKELETDGTQNKQDIQIQEDAKDVNVQPHPSRFAIPVMLDDGRELLMEWEAGSDLQQIATAWALQHNIPEEMVPQLVDVARQLSL